MIHTITVKPPRSLFIVVGQWDLTNLFQHLQFEIGLWSNTAPVQSWLAMHFQMTCLDAQTAWTPLFVSDACAQAKMCWWQRFRCDIFFDSTGTMMFFEALWKNVQDQSENAWRVVFNVLLFANCGNTTQVQRPYEEQQSHAGLEPETCERQDFCRSLRKFERSEEVWKRVLTQTGWSGLKAYQLPASCMIQSSYNKRRCNFHA